MRPSVLILASRFDLTCDYVVSQLIQRNTDYLRLNSEDLSEFSFVFRPDRPSLECRFRDDQYVIDGKCLKSIIFRRPVYFRYPSEVHDAERTLIKEQWGTFVRGLMVFDHCLWMNNPAATYRAENKVVQLSTAKQIGFEIPRTHIANTVAELDYVASDRNEVAVKGLDTILMRTDTTETFGYTTIADVNELAESNMRSMPFIIQQALCEKLDLRVTVVGERVFCASVTADGDSITGDWRLKKTGAVFTTYELPSRISALCVELLCRLGLSYGAIDLALEDGTYYFLEINPTGEWAWLVDEAGQPIDEAVSELLTC